MKEIIQFINKKCLKNNFFFEVKNEKKMIPICFLKETKNKKTFQSLFLETLCGYIIDDKTIFSEEKNDIFLLLEQMNENNFFKGKYKENTNKYINDMIDNRNNIIYKDAIIVLKNSKKVFKNKQDKEEKYYLKL